jgi:hypothetical protein
VNKAELIKALHALEQQVKTIAIQNKHVLEAQQVVSSALAQYLRDEENRILGFKENFMLQVQALRQDSAKLANEYRQELATLRADWAKTFLFN